MYHALYLLQASNYTEIIIGSHHDKIGDIRFEKSASEGGKFFFLMIQDKNVYQ